MSETTETKPDDAGKVTEGKGTESEEAAGGTNVSGRPRRAAPREKTCYNCGQVSEMADEVDNVMGRY